MIGMEPKEPTNLSRFDGLSPEIGKIIRDPEFQKTVKIFRNNQTLFRVVKGLGFSLALASGLFGYFLKANSEADDRKAAAVTNIINEKKEWYKKVNKGMLEVRKTRFLIRYDCEYRKPLSLYEQGLRRFLARNELVESFNGVGEVFNEEVLNTFLELTSLDESIRDVCAEKAPDDQAWWALSRRANNQMRASIKADHQRLEKISEGILSDTFLRF
jgi:hypothetical protein